MVRAEGAVRAAFVERGRKDWESILLNRARELAPGGRLCLFNFGIDGEGRHLGHSGGVSMFDTYDTLWAKLRDEGVITGAEYIDTNFPQHFRTVDEFTAPLLDESGPVHAAGLRLEHVETRVVGCPYARDFAAQGDAEKFAREYIPTLRSWKEAIFAKGLSPERPEEDRAAIVDRFYDSYEAAVRAAPEGHGMDYVHCYLVIRKD